MMALADDLRADIADLLNDPDTGRAITLRNVTPGTYNAADGSTASATTTDISTRGLLLGYSDSLVNNTDILRGDRRCYVKLQGISYTAKIGDKVITSDNTYTVVNFKTIELGGSVVVYILQVRR